MPSLLAALHGRLKAIMAGGLDKATITKAYARWAPVYDLVFGAVFERGRKASIAAAERIGGRILEVGVGTGISLPDYSRSNRLVGIDISEPMLRKAHGRVRDLKLDNVEALSVMDVGHLGFPDDSFDVVVAQYVITAVPDPEAALDEFARVLKPGGEIILVNHISAEGGMRRAFELQFAPIARRLGWRPEFEWARLQHWIDRHPRHAGDRAQADAAARAFLADPVRQDADVTLGTSARRRPLCPSIGKDTCDTFSLPAASRAWLAPLLPRRRRRTPSRTCPATSRSRRSSTRRPAATATDCGAATLWRMTAPRRAIRKT